jgi:hypothetical protein
MRWPRLHCGFINCDKKIQCEGSKKPDGGKLRVFTDELRVFTDKLRVFTEKLRVFTDKLRVFTDKQFFCLLTLKYKIC